MALAAGAAADTPKKGGTLVIGSPQTPRHLNPAVQSGVATGMPGAQIFATPLRFDENWNPQPYLAESWKVSADGMSVTLNLRKNAKFHDGKPVTSEDVAFSIATIKKNHPFKSMFAPVAKVDTPDPHTAILRLSKPHPAILLAMSSSLCAIIPKHVYGDGTDAKRHPMNLKPVGSGPFRFVEYVKGQHIILERDPNFFLKGKPYLDKIIYKINKNSNSLALGLERGDIHLRAFNTKSRELGRLKKNENLVVTAQGYAAIGPIAWLAFNLKHPILGKKAVRQAIAYAVDRKFINEALHSGLSKPALGPIAMGNPLADQNAKRYDLDLDKANKMLDEAGYPRKEGGHPLQGYARYAAVAAGRCRIPQAAIEESRHRRESAHSAGLPDLGELGQEPRIRHHRRCRVQLGRSGDRRAPHLSDVQHPQGRDLVEYAKLRQPEGRRAPGSRRRRTRSGEAQGKSIWSSRKS